MEKIVKTRWNIHQKSKIYEKKITLKLRRVNTYKGTIMKVERLGMGKDTCGQYI